MKNIFLFIILFSSLLLKSSLHAQHQHDKWYFGDFAALDFSSGSPVQLPAGQMSALEGSACISDSCTGNLLFYSNGTQLWDGSHAIMSNGSGILGGSSSTQSAMIIPYVGSLKKYYLFTTDEFGGPNGFRYSVIDMSLPGNGTIPSPLGAVVPAQKNILLAPITSERQTAAMHSNCRDIWVLEHGVGNNTFRAWLITSTGVSATPVTSNVGTAPAIYAGFLRISHNGKKIILTDYNGTGNNVFMYDFNNATGVVSNQVNVTAAPATGITTPYTAEFSPDDNLFYVGYLGGIDQFMTNSPATTQVQISNNPGRISAIQLGPDCKIYSETGGQTSISFIANPNSPGLACGYSANSIPLGAGKLSGDGFSYMFIWKPKACTPNTAGFTYTITPCSLTAAFTDTSADCSIRGRTWIFGDPGSGPANTSTLQNPTHTYSATGTYTVTLIEHKGGCLADTTFLPVTIFNSLNSSTSIQNSTCGNNDGSATVTPIGGTAPFTYTWSPIGGTTATATNLPAGTYSCIISDVNGCADTAVVTIINSNAPVVTTNVTSNVLCFGGNSGSASTNITGGTPAFTYSWSNGQTNSTATTLISGNYTVMVTDAGGCTSTATATITQPTQLTSSVTAVNNTCNGGNSGTATINASGGTPGYSYLWNNGQTGPAATALSSGNYTVTVTDINGCMSQQTVSVTQPAAITATITTTPACGNNNGSALATTGGGTPGYTYNWSPAGGTSAFASGLSSGTYTCTVTDANGCTKAAATTVITYPNPVASTSGNVTIAWGDNTTLTASGGNTYLWSNGAVSTIINIAPLTNTMYCVTVMDTNGCTNTACATIFVEPLDCSSSATGELFIPNAFSPNGDNENDEIKLFFGNMNCIKSYEFSIYNRWGETVYETTSPVALWDGTTPNGKNENTAVFAYYLKATLISGKEITKKGNITLLR